jgi:hypothetical protein
VPYKRQKRGVILLMTPSFIAGKISCGKKQNSKSEDG